MISFALLAIVAVESVLRCILLIILFMPNEASLDWSASFLTSPATTSKPLPASPALAASIEAFKESKFVCSAISTITLTIFRISFISVFNSLISTTILFVTFLVSTALLFSVLTDARASRLNCSVFVITSKITFMLSPTVLIFSDNTFICAAPSLAPPACCDIPCAKS